MKKRDRGERKMNESEETKEIKTFPLYPYMLEGESALPNCKPISVGHPNGVRYTTSLPHPILQQGLNQICNLLITCWTCIQLSHHCRLRVLVYAIVITLCNEIPKHLWTSPFGIPGDVQVEHQMVQTNQTASLGAV